MIVFTVGIVAMTGRTNAPSVTGDARYPHYVCTIKDYCEGNTCARDTGALIAYLAHEDGKPRVEMAGLSPRATFEQAPQQLIFTSTGGDIQGQLRIYTDRAFDFVGTDSTGSIDHRVTGQCDRRVGP